MAQSILIIFLQKKQKIWHGQFMPKLIIVYINEKQELFTKTIVGGIN